jgi:hypothetical protein
MRASRNNPREVRHPLLWYMGRVQIIKGIFVISIKYRSLNVNRVKWKIALELRRNIILGAKFMLP